MAKQQQDLRELDFALFSDAAFSIDTCAAKLGCALFVCTGSAQNLEKVTLEREIFEQPHEGEWLNIARISTRSTAHDVLMAEAQAAYVAWTLAERVLCHEASSC